MDDIVWWGDSRAAVRAALIEARTYAAEHLALQVKEPTQIGRSTLGLSLCGYRILPGCLRLSRRRKHRYAACRRQWEHAYAAGLIDARTLQAGYAGALAITLHADAVAWRRAQLRRVPLAAPLSAL
jgi:RNA-directed DNA polymerase